MKGPIFLKLRSYKGITKVLFSCVFFLKCGHPDVDIYVLSMYVLSMYVLPMFKALGLIIIFSKFWKIGLSSWWKIRIGVFDGNVWDTKGRIKQCS